MISYGINPGDIVEFDDLNGTHVGRFVGIGKHSGMGVIRMAVGSCNRAVPMEKIRPSERRMQEYRKAKK